ncbi:MAG: hypothetical protein HZA79_13320 [Sphingobacteriales bacterium]|nr:hypothetical protein [Sphingobacteriales bacterium]
MKKSLFLVCLLAASYTISAQGKPRFSSQNTAGILVGGHANAPQVQTINGISWQNWFTGIGTGIDWYKQRSIPLFWEVERGFQIAPRRKFYFSSGAGANFPWGDSRGYISYGWETAAPKMIPGLYWNAGFGYKIGVGKQNDAVLLQLGFSNKMHREEVTTVYPCFNPPCPENKESFKYNFRALSLKLGWGF